MSNFPRFLLDENVPKSVKRFLESKGISTEYASKGVSNSQAFSLAKERALVLVTCDTDFLNVSLYSPSESAGIIVFRIHPPKAEKLVKALSLLLAKTKEFKGKLFLVTETGFKVTE
jgi:predicted nuclease of predicted toxin-antitoxin system